MAETWGYVVGAGVTAVSLLFNQWRADQRDQRRSAEERLREDERWNRSQQTTTAEWRREDERRWVHERREIYARYIAAIDPWVRDSRAWAVPEGITSPDEIDEYRDRPRSTSSASVMGELETPAAELAILGGGSVREAATSLVAQLFAFEIMRVGPDTTSATGWRNLVGAVNSRYDNLLAAMREDLGVGGIATEADEVPADPYRRG